MTESSGLSKRAITVVLLVTALFLAVSNLISSHISRNILTVPDGNLAQLFTAVLLFIFLGVWFQFISAMVVVPILDIIFNKKKAVVLSAKVVDKGTKTIKMHLISFVSATLGMIALLPMLYAYQKYDAAIVVPLSIMLPLLFIGLIDMLRGRVDKRKFVWPAIVVLIGSLEVSMKSSQITELAWPALLLLLASALFMALGEHVDQNGRHHRGSALYSKWRMFYLAVIGTAAALALTSLMDTKELFASLAIHRFESVFWFLVIMQAINAATNYLKTFFKGGESTVSNVTFKLATAGAFSFILTLFLPGLFGVAITDAFMLLIRSLGIVLLCVGLISLEPALYHEQDESK